MFDFIDLGNGLINVVLLLVILVVLVVIHEFGHFVVARRAGVKVHEFGIGFPPRAADLSHRQEGHGLHAQLAAHRRLRPPGGGGGRVGRSARVRPPAAAHPARDPARRRGHELPAGLRHLHRHRLRSPTRSRTCASPVSSPARPAAAGRPQGRPARPARNATTARQIPTYDKAGDVIIAIDGQRFLMFDSRRAARLPPLDYLRAHAGQQVTLTVQQRRRRGRAKSPVTLRFRTARTRARSAYHPSRRFGQANSGARPADGSRTGLRSARWTRRR